jgi:signal transduction histidine kinase/ActR/RegA family two-component response regulator
LALALTLAFIPIGAAFWLDAAREQREGAAETRARLARVVESAEREQRQLLVSAERELIAWTRTPAVRDGSRAACESALATLIRSTPEYVFPTRIDAKGIITCGGTNPASIGLSVAANPLFPMVMASDSAIVGDYMRSSVLPEPLMPVNVAVRDSDGRSAGVLSVGIRMRWLTALAARSDLPPETVIALVDDRGLVLARIPDGGYVGQVLPDGYTSEQLRQGRTGGLNDGVSFDNIPRVIAFTRLPSPSTRGVGLSASVPLATLTAAIDARQRQRFSLFAIALLATALVAWAATRALLAGDVATVARAAERIGTGDFGVRTGVTTAAQEVRQLADAVDGMASRLGEREARALQAQKLESLGRLAGGIAHDFNNLLTAIVGNVEETRDVLPAGSPERRNLDDALDATRRSGALTKQLLTFARRDEVPATATLVGPVVHETMHLLERTLGAAIAIHVEVTGNPVALLDRGRLEQALLNLSLNARDAMPTGGTLRLRVRRDDEEPPPGLSSDDGWVRVDVADSGTGMTPEVRARLFEPFFTTKPVGQGTGLGLAMVYATMQQMGGTVTVRTATGAGTVVTLWLRAAATAESATPVSRAVAPASPGRVLLAEDEPSVRALAVRVLRRAGYSVEEAPNGAAALALLEAGGASAYDVLLTDLVMPALGGVALATAARKMRPDLPVVMMTGYAGTDEPAALLAMPHTALLEKPFDVSNLLNAVAQVRQDQG